jgi:hypothetical protein
MGNKRTLLIFVLICTLLTPFIISAQDTELVPTTHVILAVTGNPMVLRFIDNSEAGYTRAQPVSAGMFITSQDTFSMMSSSDSVIVLCADEQVVTVNVNLAPAQCSEAVSPDRKFVINGITIYQSSRRSSGATVLTLFPRNTVLLTAPDILQWTAYKPSSQEDGKTISYHVELQSVTAGGVDVLAEAETSNTYYNLAQFQPAVTLSANLPNGATAVYQVVVTPLVNGAETGETDPYLPYGFCILDPSLRSTVQQEAEQINSLAFPSGVTNLPDTWLGDARKYYLALYYSTLELYAPALDILNSMAFKSLGTPLSEEEIASGRIPGSSAFYILMAHIYNAQRLPSFAQTAYQQAYAIAQDRNDLYSQALVLELQGDLLGGGVPALPEAHPAYRFYTDAIGIYEGINDDVSAQRVRNSRDRDPSVATSTGTSFEGPCSRTE